MRRKTLRSSLRQALAALPSMPLNKRVLFILSHGGMTAMAAGQQTGADAAIRAAGLQNAMQGFTRYQPLSGGDGQPAGSGGDFAGGP